VSQSGMETYQSNQVWVNSVPDTSCHTFTTGGQTYTCVSLKWRYPSVSLAIENEFVFTDKEQIDKIIAILQKAKKQV
jgi:hypothetical protein